LCRILPVILNKFPGGKLENKEFNPDLQLEHGERAVLAATAATPGFVIMHRIFRSEVDKFLIALINADPANSKEVVSRQLLAKAAAQFYQAVTTRINEEVMLYTHAPRADDKPIDITEQVLDIGEVQSFLEGDDDNE
jgi:hypothetical protein